jgi:hypothetical protein
VDVSVKNDAQDTCMVRAYSRENMRDASNSDVTKTAADAENFIFSPWPAAVGLHSTVPKEQTQRTLF